MTCSWRRSFLRTAAPIPLLPTTTATPCSVPLHIPILTPARGPPHIPTFLPLTLHLSLSSETPSFSPFYLPSSSSHLPPLLRPSPSPPPTGSPSPPTITARAHHLYGRWYHQNAASSWPAGQVPCLKAVLRQSKGRWAWFTFFKEDDVRVGVTEFQTMRGYPRKPGW